MAKVDPPISANSSAPESPTSAPNDLTLDKVLGEMLPYFSDVFEVANWLRDHIRRGKIRVLAGGVVMPPRTFPAYVDVEATIAPDGRTDLFFELKRSLEWGEGNYIPVKQWVVEHKSFDICFGPVRNRKRRPRLDRDCWLLIEAAAYVVGNGLPKPPSAESLLLELQNIHGKQCPGRSVALEVLGPFMKRMRDVLGR